MWFLEHYDSRLSLRCPEPWGFSQLLVQRHDLTCQRLVMGERRTSIREAGVRNLAEGRLGSGLAVFERS